MGSVHLWRWYMWLPVVGIAAMWFFGTVQPFGLHPAGMALICIGLTFVGIAEVACHMLQTTIFPPGALGPGTGAGKGERIIRQWTTPGVILYLVALLFFAAGMIFLLPGLIEGVREVQAAWGAVHHAAPIP